MLARKLSAHSMVPQSMENLRCPSTIPCSMTLWPCPYHALVLESTYRTAEPRNMGTEVMGHLGSSKWRMKATVIQAKSVNEQSSDSAVKVSCRSSLSPEHHILEPEARS